MKVDVVSLGIVKRDDSPAIHYPPGRYEVADDIEAALREQGVLAPEPAPPALQDPPAGDTPSTDGVSPGGGRKGRGA